LLVHAGVGKAAELRGIVNSAGARRGKSSRLVERFFEVESPAARAYSDRVVVTEL